MPKQKNELNSTTLKNILWDTLKSVQNGNTNAQKANAICANARTICSIVKLELQMQKLLGKKPTATTTKFINK
jgi:hypothetical protein